MKKYYVTTINTRTTEEWVDLATTDLEEAKKVADFHRYRYQESKQKNYTVEIRTFVEDIEDEYCTCFDYDTIDF